MLAQTYPHWFLQIVNDGGPPHLVESENAPYRHHPRWASAPRPAARHGGGEQRRHRSRLVREIWDGREYVRRRVLEFGPESEMVTAADLAGRNVFPPIALLVRRSMVRIGVPSFGDCITVLRRRA